MDICVFLPMPSPLGYNLWQRKKKMTMNEILKRRKMMVKTNNQIKRFCETLQFIDY